MLAFTLVELLVVVLILGALAFAAIPRISQSAHNAKKRACEANIRLLNSEIERYRVTNGAWPPNLWTIRGDKDLFPDGSPQCPITGIRYIGLNDKHQVNMALHNH